MIERLRELWNGAGGAGRAGVALGAVLILAAAAAAIAWALREDYQPLFTELDARDASAITGELERMKVPYKVAEDGHTLLVDRGTVHATRLKIMGKGVDLKGTVGFEIFNNTDFGMTEFAQRINYQRALQGELARTIMAFEEVKSARVHLVLPESGLLRRNAIKPKASVTLAMRGERPLQPEQIQGIQRLVAAAVPEMDPAAVTVLDQQGVALSRRAEAEGEADLGGARLEAKKEIEAYLTRKVVAVLDKALGPGQGIVSVDVALSVDQVKTTREDVLPAGGTREGAVARRRDSTQTSPVQMAVVGVVQSAGEMPRGPSASSSEVEYAHGRKVEQTVSLPGGIRRVSVGILLPAHIEPRQADSLKQVIAMTVGLDFARGDGIAFSWTGRAAAGAAPTPRRDGAGAELRGEASPARAPRELAPWPTWLAAAAVLALLASLAGYRFMRSRREPASSSRPLTPAEKEELLARVRRWLAEGAPPDAPGPEARS